MKTVIVNTKEQFKELINYIFFDTERLRADIGEIVPWGNPNSFGESFETEEVMEFLGFELTDQEQEDDDRYPDIAKLFKENEDRFYILTEFEPCSVTFEFSNDFDRGGDIQTRVFLVEPLKDSEFNTFMKNLYDHQEKRKEEVRQYKEYQKQKVGVNK